MPVPIETMVEEEMLGVAVVCPFADRISTVKFVEASGKVMVAVRVSDWPIVMS